MKVMIFTLLFAFLLSSCVTFIPTALLVPPIPDKTILPLSFEYFNGLPVVTIKIQEKEYNVVINTGMPDYLSLKPHVFNEIVCNKMEQNSRIMDINGELKSAKYYKVESIQISQIVMNEVIVSQELRSFFPENIDGSIGRSFLINFNILVDYNNKEMILYNPEANTGSSAYEGWNQVDFSCDNRGIILQGSIPNINKRISLCFDTGCAIIYNNKAYGTLKRKLIPGFKQYYYTDDNGVIFYDFNIGNISIKNMAFTLNDFPTPFDGLIGYNFLTEFKVYFDFTKNILLFNGNDTY